MKKVSIIVPVYNMEKSLGQSVDALLAQDYENIEIILVNDGSKDGSGEVCDRLAAKDGRVRAIHTENRGSGPARNAGVAAANGEYAYFPDADDYLEPYAISRMVAAMEDGECDLVVFGFRNVNQNGKTTFEKSYPSTVQNGEEIRKNYADYMAMARPFCIQGAPWNKFFDLRVIRENGVEFPPLRRHQDEGFIGRYMCHAKNVRFISDVLYTYYVNDLKKEWQKYPVDYIDAVTGLYAVRKETILTWNPADTLTHDMIAREYICNVIKAMELTFSPKHSLSAAERKEMIKRYAEQTGLSQICTPGILGKYQKMIMQQIEEGRYSATYDLLRFKVAAEKSGILSLIRRG